MDRSEQDVRHYTPTGGVTEERGSYKDFMCDCGEEEKRHCQEVVERVCAALKCTPEHMVTAVVYDLIAQDRPVGITGVPCDMWCAVTARQGDDRFFIQCDKVEHGFARLWQMVQELNHGG